MGKFLSLFFGLSLPMNQRICYTNTGMKALRISVNKFNDIFQRFNSLSEGIKVEFAYLFGSIPQGSSGPLSDIDIAVYLNKEPSLDEELDLHHFLSRELKTDSLDLVILNRSKNIILMDEIIRTGLLLFEKNPELREDFELNVIHDAIDFKEQRRLFIGR